MIRHAKPVSSVIAKLAPQELSSTDAGRLMLASKIDRYKITQPQQCCLCFVGTVWELLCLALLRDDIIACSSLNELPST